MAKLLTKPVSKTARPPAKQVTPVAEKPRMSKPHEIVLSTVTQNAVGILSWSKFAGEADLQELVQELDKRIDKIKDGDMSSVEAMLFGQAKVLETMFTSLARRASNQDALKQFQVNLTLALKAQAQCRATLEALAEIKNPRPIQFVKRANISNGPQQVNNGAVVSRTETFASEPNKLWEAQHGNYLDTRTPGTAGRADTHLEAVG